MPGFNPDNINIHDLTIEEPEKGVDLPFDAKRDISEKDWEQMEKENQRRLREGVHYQNIWSSLVAQDTLGRRREVPHICIENIDKTREECSHSDMGPHRISPNLLRNLKIMGFNIVPNEEELKLFNEAIKSTSWETSLPASTSAKILDIEGYDLPDEKISGFVNELADNKRRSPYAAAHMAAELKILGKDIKIDKEEWGKFLGELEKIREEFRKNKGNMHMFFYLASNMAILSADEIKIPTGGGLKLIQYKKSNLSPEVPEIPEQRKF